MMGRFAGTKVVVLRNLSAGGLSAFGSGVEVGDRLTVDLPGLGSLQAEVKWIAGDCFGAAFAGTGDLRLRFINGLPRQHAIAA
jgi:hypothetical protein